MKADTSHIEMMSNAYITLKPDDAEKLKKFEPGVGVRITIVGELESIAKRKAEKDNQEYDGDITVTVQEIRIERQSNQFMAMANDD